MSTKSKSKSRRSRQAADADTAKIGFVGAGKITESIINGLVVYGKVEPARIFVAAPSTTNTERLRQNYRGLKASKRNLDIFGKYNCDIIFIAVNGNVIRNLYILGGNRPAPLTTNYIPNMKHPFFVLSLVTGYDIKVIKEVLLNPEHPGKYMVAMHRIMLNCAVAHGCGVGAADVDPTSHKFPKPVYELISKVVPDFGYLPEREMDAACAMCGAGLAFSFYFINAISDGALKIGLNRSAAIKFTAKTVKCACQVLLDTDKHPNELKDESCAPSSGAIYGLSILDKMDVGSGVSAAVEAAHKRAQSLAKDDTH